MEDTTQLTEAALAARPDLGPRFSDQPTRVEMLGEILVGRRLSPARAELRSLRDQGHGAAQLIRELLVPTARHLGELWLDDRVPFADVTLGLGRLQTLHNELASDLPLPSTGAGPVRALLSTVPGETHTFGVAVAAAQLHARGWQVTGSPGSTPAQLLSAVRRGWFEVVGLSIGGERHLEQLAALVPALRDASSNDDLRIVVSGALARIDEASVTETAPDLVILDDRDPRLLELVAPTT